MLQFSLGSDTEKGRSTMRSMTRKWLALTFVLVGGLSGLGTSSAEAQFFGFSYNSPGLSIGVNQPAYYGGVYPVAPVVVPRPVVVAPPLIYGGRPYYGGAYGYRGGYYGPRGPYRGGYGPHRPY